MLRQSDERAYFLATEQDFQRGGLPSYPYRNYFYGIGVAYEGERHIRIGTATFQLKPGSIMVIGPGILRQWLDLNLTYQHEAIFFTPELFKAPVNPHFLAELAIFKSNIQHVINPAAADFEAIVAVFKLLKQYRNQSSTVAALAFSLVELLTNLLPVESQPSTNRPTSSERSQNILRKFDDLLLKHYLENKEVAFYAEKMNLTASHLSETIKTMTGKSAKKRIEDMLLLEAKSLLKQTDMSIKEITYWLGFEDPSYFVKFFKNAAGVTPLGYRQQP